MIRNELFLPFPEIQAVVKVTWDYNAQRYELLCGTTYIGHALTIDAAKDAAYRWVKSLTT
jgi:hypothetical protein